MYDLCSLWDPSGSWSRPLPTSGAPGMPALPPVWASSTQKLPPRSLQCNWTWGGRRGADRGLLWLRSSAVVSGSGAVPLAAGVKGQRDRETPPAACGDRKVGSNRGKCVFSLKVCFHPYFIVLTGTEASPACWDCKSCKLVSLDKRRYLFRPGFVSSSVVSSVIPMW